MELISRIRFARDVEAKRPALLDLWLDGDLAGAGVSFALNQHGVNTCRPQNAGNLGVTQACSGRERPPTNQAMHLVASSPLPHLTL